MNDTKKYEIWRWRCPNGHTTWEKRTSYNDDGFHNRRDAKAPYYCEHCGPFDELIDKKGQP